MRRRYELIDMVVVIGFCATIAAAGLLYMAANGKIYIPPAENLANGTGQVIMGLDDARWLQPILGQAIVDRDLLDRRHATVLSNARIRLAGVSAESARWQKAPYSYLDRIRSSAMWAEPDYAARVQVVMGHIIVQFTQRGVWSDMLSSEDDSVDFNTRMIDQADARGQQMDANCLVDRQAGLGRAIVGATQASVRSSTSVQKRLGLAII